MLIFLSLIYCQQENIYSNIDNCIFGNIKTNNSIIYEINEEILNEIIFLNFPNLLDNSVLTLFEEEYQIFLFRIANCTNKFLYDFNSEENNFNNKLHLFSIEGNIESNPNIIKLVIQTKKELQIFYYENLSRIFSNSDNLDNDTYFKLKINIFPYFINKIFYNEEYQFFKNHNINIFNENEKIFNDICFIYESFNITKPPELRKSLYFYKNDNITYPLLNSNNNCFIFKNTTSYEDKIFLLEYKCRKNFNISAKDIKIKGVSIVSKENIQEYNGPNSLKDQNEILKCYKEGFKSKYIKNNVGFHISLVLIFIVFICLILLVIQKYEIKYEEELILLEKKKKKKTLKESLKEKKEKKNIHHENIVIIQEKEKNKKKRKKKKKIINSDNEEENKEYNDDLNWYSNKIISDDQKEKEESEKSKEDKKKKKKKKNIYNKNIIEKDKTNNSYDNYDNNNKNWNDSDYNYKNEEKNDMKNKTIPKFPNAYEKFQINSVNQLKQKLNLRRLIIITNLGKNLNNLEKSDVINNNSRLSNNLKNKNEKDSNNSLNNSESNNENNIKNSINNLMENTKEKIENEKDINKNEKLGNIIGIEDNTFWSNIMRDYLNFEDASYFDRRENCHIFCHYMKLKNDLINIFCCDYSFSPYTIRLIKFAFFFHFLFYLETLCIGQKYYFNKYYSNDFQEFLVDNNFYINNLVQYSPLNNSNTSETLISNFIKNTTFLKSYLDIDEIDFANIHYLYTFKYAFPRVLISAAISLISYIFTSLLSPRRKVMKILLNPVIQSEEKNNEIKQIAKTFKIIFVIFGIIAFLLMIFFFYSVTIYFSVFENAKYDIPQSFLLSGLIRFIFDILLWSFITELRVCSLQTHFGGFYDIVNKIYELN